MERVFFIGDIHGCSKTFRKLVTDEIGFRKTDGIYCVGDYIDRGTDSKGVIDFILELREHQYMIHTLRGNHEQMLLDSEKGGDAFSLWMMNGGGVTLKSFDALSVNDLKPVYKDFFRQTGYFIQGKDFIVVHAGLNFNAPDPLEDKESMLWIRDFQVDKAYLDGKLLIHGHTPMNNDAIRSQDFKSPFNIDGGCVYKNNEELGNLFALNLHERKLLEVPNID
jgi:serine/threonine protein phosphatase 1